MRPPRALVLTWLALLSLVGATLGIAFLPLGPGNLVAGLAIAAVKAALVLVWFMRLPASPRLAWVAGAAGLFWLVILFGLTSTDYLTRFDAPA